MLDDFHYNIHKCVVFNFKISFNSRTNRFILIYKTYIYTYIRVCKSIKLFKLSFVLLSSIANFKEFGRFILHF